MNNHKIIAGLVGIGLVATGALADAGAEQGEPVSFSVAVTDRDGRAVRGLTAADFSVRENGRPVQLDRVTPSDATATERSIVLLLTGSGGDDALTVKVQRIARDFISRSGPNDRISVVRLAHRNDEVAGTRADMLMRVAEYRAPYGEPYNAKTWEGVLRAVTRISRQLESGDEPTRRAIVWIGAPYIFDVVEPQQKQSELLWPYWVEALTSTASADVSLYMIDPKGLTGSIRINPDGLIAQTGGQAFDNSNEFKNAVDRIWDETGSYYRLEYEPQTGRSRELQTINVKVSKPGVDVRARKSR